MYIEQFCLAVLFFLKISDGVVFLAEGILMLVLMALTLSIQVLYQRSFDRTLSSYLFLYIPMTCCFSNHSTPANVIGDSEDTRAVGASQESAW